MDDFRGKKLSIGDTVAISYQRYTGARLEMREGTVVGFTPKNVRVRFYRYVSAIDTSVELKTPDKICKITQECET